MGDDRPLVRIDVESHPVEDITFGTFARLAAFDVFANAEDLEMSDPVADRAYDQALRRRYPNARFARRVDPHHPALGAGLRVRITAWRDGKPER